TNGFVGEFLVLLGTFKSTHLAMWLGVLASTGVILGASYMLWMVQRVFFGPLVQVENARLHDVNIRELATALPFVVMVLAMGVFPGFFRARLKTPPQRYVAGARVGPDVQQRDEDPGVTVLQLPPPAPVAAMPAGASARR